MKLIDRYAEWLKCKVGVTWAMVIVGLQAVAIIGLYWLIVWIISL